MPAGNQGQSRRNGGNVRNNSPENAGNRESTGEGQEHREGLAEIGNRLYESAGEVGRRAEAGYRQAETAVSSNPGSSVLIGLGLGFGIGLALTALLGRREESWSERYLPESLRNAHWPDSVRNAPDALHGKLHHLGESIRDLPAAIAKHLPSR